MKRIRRYVGFLLAVLMGLALAAGTPAGTAITNQATATYIDSAGQPRTTTSNLVTTIVQQVYSFTITPDGNNENNPGQVRSGLPGSQVLFNYRVRNNGNGTDTISLATVQGTSDNFDLQNVRIYLDANCNGNVDAGEGQVTQVTLPADGEACLVVAAVIPSGATSGQNGNLNLVGTSQGNASVVDNNNWAQARATAQAALTAFKAATPSGSVAPGTTGTPITYTISGANTGGSAAYGYPVTVDGTSRTGILIEDVIPNGLQVTAMPTGSAGAGTVQFVYNAGSGWSTLTSSNLPLTGNGTVKIGMFIQGSGPFFPQGAQYTFSFKAQVPSGVPAGTSYSNFAVVRFDANGDGDADDPGETVTTNTTTNTVGAAYAVQVGPYEYPLGNGTGTYTVGAYTITRSADQQTVSAVYSGTTVIFRHTLRNTGNTADSFTLSPSGQPSGWACQLVADDLATPISGPVGPVAAGGDLNFALRCQVPAGYTGGPVSIVLTATSQANPSAQDTTTDTVTTVADGYRFDLFGGVDGYPPYTQVRTPNGTLLTSDDTTTTNRSIYQSGTTHPERDPGQSVTYRLRVQNLNPNGLADNYTLNLIPQAGYAQRVASVLFYADPDDDGIPNGAPISNTGLVAHNAIFNLVAVVTLRNDAPPGPAGFTFEAKSGTSFRRSLGLRLRGGFCEAGAPGRLGSRPFRHRDQPGDPGLHPHPHQQLQRPGLLRHLWQWRGPWLDLPVLHEREQLVWVFDGCVRGAQWRHRHHLRPPPGARR